MRGFREEDVTRVDLLDIEAKVIRKTDGGALLIDDGSIRVYVPASLVEVGADGVITLPRWLAEEKGLA
jgi:flagellar basal body rod protein FlgF